MRKASLLGAALITAAACWGQSYSNETTGAVFAATNSADGNSVVMYKRLKSGKLNLIGSFPTHGRGEGGVNDPMQSNNSVVLSADHSYLLAVNAGSSTISVFKVLRDGLYLLETTPSGGGNPISITMHDDLVYVANFGGVIHTAGFRLQPWGKLDPIPDSKLTTSSLDTEVSTIALSPDGQKLVLSERQTNKVDVFTLKADGSLTNPVFNDNADMAAFGLQFTATGQLLVTATSGSLTSYTINADNTLMPITAKSPSSGGATCWVVNNGTYAWTSNTLTSNISAFGLAAGGTLLPLGIVAMAPATGPSIFPPVQPATSFPTDMALSADGHYLYQLYSGRGQVIGYHVEADGKLTQVDAVSPYPAQSGAQGLAAY